MIIFGNLRHPMAEKQKEKTVHVSEETHSKVKTHLGRENMGGDIGKFFDKAALEKLEKEKIKSNENNSRR